VKVEDEKVVAKKISKGQSPKGKSVQLMVDTSGTMDPRNFRSDGKRKAKGRPLEKNGKKETERRNGAGCACKSGEAGGDHRDGGPFGV